ncbi:MAG TPA: hypothetical protein VL405_04555 [Sphingomonas sp.]|jgi:hypothetical protein|nr:hypothetical protein [Sphingomonas sp.]
MYKIVVDRSHALVSLTAAGLITDEELAAAAGELHKRIRSLGTRAGQHVTLYDLSELQVVSSSVLEGFGRYFTDPAYRPIWARRAALVTRSPMVTFQMGAVRGETVALNVFNDRAQAIGWLLATDEPNAAAA